MSQPDQTSSADGAAPSTPRRARWHYVYFVLAAVDIAAITASLSFSRAIISDFSDAVEVNHRWVQRQGLYSDLSKIAGEMSTPGTDVFESKNVDREAMRLKAAASQFEEHLELARTEARQHVPEPQVDEVIRGLSRFGDHVEEAHTQSLEILRLAREDKYDEAVHHLALMSHAHGEGSKELNELNQFIRGVQDTRFEVQLSEAETMRGYQSWFGAGVLLMVGFVSWYGHKLSRAIHDSIDTTTAQAAALADQEARLRTIFNTASEGIVTVNDQGVIESCNQATLQLFDCEESAIVGTLLGALVDRTDSDEITEENRSLRILDIQSLIGTKQELIAHRPDGSQFYAEFSAAEVKFNDHSVITGIMTDITDRKAFEEELQEARVEAEAATAAKSQFLANMSHEIRTPMSAIIGYSDLLLEPNQSRDERNSCVDTIRRNADHLLTLINDILDLSKIEADKMTLEQIPCSPCQIVSDVASLMRVRATEKEIDFHINYDSPVPASITSDPVRVRQVLINLVGNSIKFTKKGAVKVHIWSENLEGADPTMHFRVVDSGIGMNDEQVTRLFRPFTQADYSTTRQFGGTGLGLTICKRLVEAMGGEISVSSVPGLGSSFDFHVPTGSLDGIEIIQEPSETTLEPTLDRNLELGEQDKVEGRVLLAEDGVDNRRLISYHLKKAGCKVTTAENGKIAHDEARAAVERGEPFDIIFMDMQMPVMDGYTATSKLKEAGYEYPICALTAHAMNGDREKCLGAGCDDYLTKPINADKLIAAVRQYTSRRLGNTATADFAASTPENEQIAASAVSESAQASPATPDDVTQQTPDETSTVDSAAPKSHTQEESGIQPLISEFANDPDMIEIIEMFIDGLDERIDSIENAFAQGNYSTVAGIAHQMKGAAGGYGYPTLSEMAFEVERLAKAGGPQEKVQAALGRLIIQCRRAIAGVRGVAESTSTSVSDIPAASTVAIETTAVDAQSNQILESVDGQIPELATSEAPTSESLTDGSPLDQIAGQIGNLNGAGVDTAQLSNALLALAQALGGQASNVPQSAATTES